MAEHRWIGPVADPTERCDCTICLRHDEWVALMEHAIAEYVGRLLDAGWFPVEIARLVRSGSPTSSRASMLVRIEIVRRSTEWVRSPEFGRHLTQARMLAERSGFRPGITHAGWFEHWYWHRGGGDLRRAERYVNHVRVAVEPVLELIGDADNLPTRPRRTRRRFRPAQTASGLPRGTFVPEPSTDLWNW